MFVCFVRVCAHIPTGLRWGPHYHKTKTTTTTTTTTTCGIGVSVNTWVLYLKTGLLALAQWKALTATT